MRHPNLTLACLLYWFFIIVSLCSCWCSELATGHALSQNLYHQNSVATLLRWWLMDIYWWIHVRFVAEHYGERIMKMVDEVTGNSVVVSLVFIDWQTVASGLLLAMLHIIKINFVITLWRNCFLFKSRIKRSYITKSILLILLPLCWATNPK